MDNIDLAAQMTMKVALTERDGAAVVNLSSSNGGSWFLSVALAGVLLWHAAKARLIQREEDLRTSRHVSLGTDEITPISNRLPAEAGLATRLAHSKTLSYSKANQQTSSDETFYF